MREQQNANEVEEEASTCVATLCIFYMLRYSDPTYTLNSLRQSRLYDTSSLLCTFSNGTIGIPSLFSPSSCIRRVAGLSDVGCLHHPVLAHINS